MLGFLGAPAFGPQNFGATRPSFNDADVEKALKMNLGFTNGSREGIGFNEQAVGRHRYMCSDCYHNNGPGMLELQCRSSNGKASDRFYCSCTMKSRFVDRWCCMQCFKREQDNNSKYRRGVRSKGYACVCGMPANDIMQLKIVCNWCAGEIRARETERAF
jgi:hypothetical protein